MSEPQDSILPPELIDLARKVVDANRAAGLRIAVAESCTGGLVSAALTEIPGSSDVFEAAFVTYSDEAKISLLGISRDVLETFGAVSVAVGWGMAQAALKRGNADVSVAITGIAGPGGDDPVEVVADRKDFGDLGRGGVRLQAALCALELLMPDAAAAPVP
jgi:nicotinamide-nucleotide amidase